MRQTSKNIKLRSNSVNYLQHSVHYERKNRVQTIQDQDKFLNKNYHNHLSMFSLFNQCLSIKKDFLCLSTILTIVYQIDPQLNFSNQRLQTIKEEIMQIKKMQKLTVHIKKMDMTIIKNQTKHIHSISPQLSAKDLLINLHIPNKIITVHIQTQQSCKKVDIDLTKLPLISQNERQSYNSINPLQFIQEGIKLRASKMQSTGKMKKIVWGNDSANKIHSANIRNSLPDLIESSENQSEQNKELNPFNDNFQSLCSKKLDFSKHTNNQKEGMFGQLQKQMDNELFKEIGKKLVSQGKQGLCSKLIETKDKSYQIPMSKRRSQPDSTLKEKNRTIEAKNKTKQPLKLGETQQIGKKFHSRQYSDHSQKNLENLFNMDTQKPKEKKKAITYKTDMSTMCAFSKSVQVVEPPVKKTIKNKQNDSINQKALMLKKGIVTSKKMVPSSSFVGITMVKSIRMKTEVN